VAGATTELEVADVRLAVLAAAALVVMVMVEYQELPILAVAVAAMAGTEVQALSSFATQAHLLMLQA
jgi:hypothetical protein